MLAKRGGTAARGGYADRVLRVRTTTEDVSVIFFGIPLH